MAAFTLRNALAESITLGRHSGRRSQNPVEIAARNKYDRESIFGLGSPDEAKNSSYAGGYSNLMSLLNDPGQTDQGLLARSLAGNDRSTAMQLERSRAGLARSGVPATGQAGAFQSAIASAGRNRRGNIVASDAMRRDALRRDDAQLLYQFIQKPRIDRYANDRGVQATQNQIRSQERSGQIAGLSSLIGSLAASGQKI